MKNYNYLYDGKGNVRGVVKASDQSVAASYAYDEFGVLTGQTLAQGFTDQPYRFSTKRYYGDLGLNYYGYRFYSAGLGRWLSRDPLEEEGGLNLYGFVGNGPMNGVDAWGLVDDLSGVLPALGVPPNMASAEYPSYQTPIPPVDIGSREYYEEWLRVNHPNMPVPAPHPMDMPIDSQEYADMYYNSPNRYLDDDGFYPPPACEFGPADNCMRNCFFNALLGVGGEDAAVSAAHGLVKKYGNDAAKRWFGRVIPVYNVVSLGLDIVDYSNCLKNCKSK